MDINLTVKLEGLEPLANAINALAAAYTGAGSVIEKAKVSSKKATDPKSAPSADIQPTTTTDVASAADPKSAEPVSTSTAETTSVAQDAPADPKPAATPTVGETAATQESQAPAEAETATGSPSSITDDTLRAAAAAAAKKDRAKVQAIVAKYAPNVSGIAQEDRAKAIKDLAAV